MLHVEYLQSLQRELEAQENRVRHLIGDKHWYSDGRHKEVLLAELLRRHVPAGRLVTNGFAINPSMEDSASREQDILVLDTQKHRPILSSGDFAIALAHTVVAAISVKTTLNRRSLKDVIEGLADVQRVCRAVGDTERPWTGAYFFNGSMRKILSITKDIASTTQYVPDCIVTPTQLLRRRRDGSRSTLTSYGLSNSGLGAAALIILCLRSLDDAQQSAFDQLVTDDVGITWTGDAVAI